MSESFKISSYRGPYEVGLGCDAEGVLAGLRQPGDVILCDRNVLALHPFLREQITDRDLIVDAEEALKSYQGLEPVLSQIIQKGITKQSRIIAIGGGITQDCSAFAASILYRGIDWIFFPTNLLSQCDSCIGSKTSVNFGAYKNLLGGFYPARQVFIDPNFLATLPVEHLMSGLGEMLHYFMVSDWSSVEFYQERFADAADGHPGILLEMIRKSLGIKKAMIERDEFDQGPRNVFNYGHTFGHALETATRYQVPHGIAVSYGMDLASLISVDQGLLSMEERNRMRQACALAATRFPLPEIDLEAYMQALSKDKKNTGKGFSPILTRGVGDMFKTTLPLDETISNRVRPYFAENLIEGDL